MATQNSLRKKHQRIDQIVNLLWAHRSGLSQSEIARRLGVNRSTINRYLPELPPCLYIDEEDDKKWKMDRAAYEFDVHLNLDEAMAVHLATRLLATRMERQNPHAASALRKLGSELAKLVPRISRHMLQSAAQMDDPSRLFDPLSLECLEKITQAWANLQKVDLCYASRSDEIHRYIFSPYFIEPYAIGQSIYIFGLREPPAAIRTFKLERIESVELLDETYSIPDDFDPQDLLNDAWGIWYTGDEPVEVVLKFSARVAARVKESRWHRSEVVEEQPDGSLLWKARIAQPVEMLPWLRGWGADVEVLGPQSLRDTIKIEIDKMVDVYVIEDKKKRCVNQAKVDI